MTRLARFALALLVLPACLTTVAVAQTPARDAEIEATTRRLATELRCPVCQGLSLQDSPSELAQEMRGVIRDQLKAGRTPDQVKGYFIDKYGEWILLEPPATGFNLVVYALPVLAVLVGLFVVWRAVKRWTKPPGTLPSPGSWADGESPTPESPTQHRSLAD